MTRAPELTGNEIRFVVMPDRTGGMREGVFREALQRANLLHPEFVICVGDLIDGYTRDPQLLEDQWSEFEAMAEALDMPFYYVPGNHDISNDWMEDQWRQRLGSPYYAFTRKEALFLVLHTEDGGESGISEEQANFVRETLAAHADARWTFLFMHRPLWSYQNQEGFGRIEEALQDRRYTLFSGHHHNYYYEPGASGLGSERFILGTAGGGSPLRGPQVGEFDHITHVTLTEAGPKVAHLALDGFVDKEVVNPSNRSHIETLRRGAYLVVEPVVAPRARVEQLEGRLALRNPADQPLSVVLELPSGEGFSSEPPRRELTLDPGQSATVPFDLRPDERGSLELADLPELRIKAVGSYPSVGDGVILPMERLWRMDWLRYLPFLTQQVEVDASFLEWSREEWIALDPPGYLREAWDWSGQADSRVSFALRRGSQALYLAVEIDDDRHLFDAGELSDALTLYLQGPDEPSRSFRLAPQPNGELALEGFDGSVEAAMNLQGKVIRIEVALPWSELGLPPEVSPFRFNLSYLDHDRPENQKPSQLYWKPLWESVDDYPKSGSFALDLEP